MIHYRKMEWSRENNLTYSMETIAIGSLFCVSSQSVQVMSDIWESQLVAEYITDEGRVSHMSVRSFYGSESEYPTQWEIDATEEAFTRAWNYEYATKLERLTEQAEEDANDAGVRGRQVVVKRGRSSVGAKGKVIAVIQRPYGMGYRSTLRNKIGIATSDDTVEVVRNGRTYHNHVDVVWVWAHNCDVMGDLNIDREALKVSAASHADYVVNGYRAKMEDAMKRYPTSGEKKAA